MVLATGRRAALNRRSLVALGLLLAMLGFVSAQPMPGGLVAVILLLTLFAMFAGAVPTAFALAAAGLILTLLTLHGLGPLIALSDDPARRLVMLQRFLAVCVLGTVPVALIVEERRRQLARLRLDQARLRLREARYRAMATISADVILVTAPGGRITYVSAAVQRLLGISAPALIGRNAYEFIHPLDAERVAAEFATLGGPVREVTVEMQIWPGGVGACEASPIWAEVRTRLGDRTLGDEVELVSVVRDISERRAQDERRSADLARLVQLAHTDSLTGLANRRRFTEHLELEWRRALREHSDLALLLIDVDRFKSFNDHYGHPAGDAALQGVAAIIAATALRPSDLAARIGGEEFAVILPSTFLSGARNLAERVRDGLRIAAIPHVSSPSGLLTVSIGICCLRPGEGEPSQLLVDRADQALYAAKTDRDTVAIAP
jgi:diguanylate cyclase (GGDEF)-like protein/PAS domain S-box-containing protein